MLLALAAAALLQFAPIATPAGLPPPAFDLRGFTADHKPTAAPQLVHGAEHDVALIAFTGPLDGECIVAEAVDVGPKHMAVPLARGAVVLANRKSCASCCPRPRTYATPASRRPARRSSSCARCPTIRRR